MGEAAVPQLRGIGNGEPEGEHIQIREHAQGNARQQQAPGDGGRAETQAEGQGYGGMGEQGGH